MKKIIVRNAHLHNLKAIDIEIPTEKLIAISGVSGSGKSTLAFDILFEAGRRSYLQALGVLASLGETHGFDEITGLMPTVAIKQGVIRRSNPRSVVGTQTRLLNYLATLYADQHNRQVSNDEAITAAYFSFNSPMGMCLACQGRGMRFELDFAVLLPTPATTLIQLYENALLQKTFAKRIERLQNKLSLDAAAPFCTLPESVRQLVLYGTPAHGIKLSSLFDFLRYKLSNGRPVNGAIKALSCTECSGYRVAADARAIVLNGKHIGQLGHMTIAELHEHLLKTARKLAARKSRSGVERLLIEKTISLTQQLNAVKLDYLTLYRPVPSLSGGELQRLFLMSHLRADISPLLYIFDEPTAGLHELEKHQLIERLRALSNSGNTVIVVEHDPQTLRAADHVIDMGPLAGSRGGEVIYQGGVAGLVRCQQSLTGQQLAGKWSAELAGQQAHELRARLPGELAARSASHSNNNLANPQRRKPRVVHRATPVLTLSGVNTNNLKNVSVKIPLGVLTGVTGLSGSGKSSLIVDTLVPALNQYFNSDAPLDEADGTADQIDDTASAQSATEEPIVTQATPNFRSLTGAERLDKCIEVSQAPIGRRANSNVVSYLGIWDRIRRCFATTAQAKRCGLTAGHFSFNASGACQQCRGSGQHQLWLGGSAIAYPCDLCEGRRYQVQILEVLYKGFSIADVLAASVAQARELFADDQPVVRMLDVMVSTGMDYITLGQPTNTLSGGEAQRVKLAKALGRQAKRLHCLYVLDEPTTGLSLYDTDQLMALLQALVAAGNSVIIVEHDPAVLSLCDWLLELGPGGGSRGGKMVAAGAPEKLQRLKKSLIGPFLE